METYSFLREFADSWMLLFLFTFFIVVIIWAFRPGASRKYADTANIPFRNAEAPAPLSGDDKTAKPKEARQ